MTIKELEARVAEYNDLTSQAAARWHQASGKPPRGWQWCRPLLWTPLGVFCREYFGKQQRRAGLAGLVESLLLSWVSFLQGAKCWAASIPVAAMVPMSSTTSMMGSDAASPREKLSVVVLTRNEASRIERCLRSVQWADEIVVVDGMSTDATVAICQRFGAKVIVRPFSGSFGEERNAGAAAAAYDWLLQLDGDDEVSPALQAAILRLLREGSPYALIEVLRQNSFLGRWMWHGGWHHYFRTLYRKSAYHFEGRVHHVLKGAGTVGRIAAPIYHYPFESVEQLVAKHDRYTSLEALEMRDQHGTLALEAIRRQLIRRPWKTLWKSYIKKRGFREGVHGWVFAVLFAGVDFLRWAKYWSLVSAADEAAAAQHSVTPTSAVPCGS